MAEVCDICTNPKQFYLQLHEMEEFAESVGMETAVIIEESHSTRADAQNMPNLNPGETAAVDQSLAEIDDVNQRYLTLNYRILGIVSAGMESLDSVQCGNFPIMCPRVARMSETMQLVEDEMSAFNNSQTSTVE